jgi:hypothetical protein
MHEPIQELSLHIRRPRLVRQRTFPPPPQLLSPPPLPALSGARRQGDEDGIRDDESQTNRFDCRWGNFMSLQQTFSAFTPFIRCSVGMPCQSGRGRRPALLTRNPYVSMRAGSRISPHTAPRLARKPANISTIWPLDANMATVMATTDHLAPSSKKQHEEQHRCTASCSDPRHPSNAHIVRVTPYYPGPIGCHRHISSGVHTPATLLVLRLLVPIAPFVRLLHRQSVFGLASCWLWFSSVGYRSV